MNDISTFEKILGKFLTKEQIVALTEEIAKGVNFLNGIIDKNEKNKARKEFVVSTFRSIDEMIEKSSKLPASLKLLYGMAKTKTHALIEPLLAKLVTENDFSDLDDIPDVNPDVTVRKTEIRENANQPQQPNGEQGGRRRRRRHGRNRNNQYQQRPETPVETFPETSPVTQKPEPQPAPQPAPKPEPKPEPKPAPAPKPEPKPESKPAPKPRKKPAKSEPEQKPETAEKTESAPKKRTVRRKPKQNAE